MENYDLAGLKITLTTKADLLKTITHRMKAGERTFVTTPYSEFLYRSLQTPGLADLFNKADISVPDGIGIFWAAKFLQIPLTVKNYYSKIFQACWQVLYTLCAILLKPTYIYNSLNGAIPSAAEGSHLIERDSSASDALSFRMTPNKNRAEKISGSDFIWDLAGLAADNEWSIYLVGGFGRTPETVAKKLQAKNYQLRVVGWSTKDPNDPTIVDDIKVTNPDMVFVAYGPVRQEQWIIENMGKLNARFYIGLGGTFDYIAGTHTSPPQFIRRVGLEWLYRLFTQPHRWKRIWQATVGLTTNLIRYKVQMTLPYRKNVVMVVLNSKNEILIGKRKPNGQYRNENHWMFPQGGLEDHEDLQAGALRELKEETGIQSVELVKISKKANKYLWRFGFSKHYRGQDQTPVYFKFTGDESEIRPDAYSVVEFTEFKWVTMQKLLDTVHALRKPLAQIVIQDLKELVYSTKSA